MRLDYIIAYQAILLGMGTAVLYESFILGMVTASASLFPLEIFNQCLCIVVRECKRAGRSTGRRAGKRKSKKKQGVADWDSDLDYLFDVA